MLSCPIDKAKKHSPSRARLRENSMPDTEAPPMIPGGIRERAMQAVMERGPTDEDHRKTERSKRYWAGVREAAKRRA